MNEQLPVKQSKETALKVHSIFATIQGEGPYCGRPAIFIRLWGCNLQCPNCDTEYSNRYQFFFSPEELLARVIMLRAGREITTVVITGGEPLRQLAIYPAISMLSRNGYSVQIETNGTYDIPEPYVWLFIPGRAMLVCSPKTGRVSKSVAKMAYAFKYVASAGNMHTDGLPLNALGHPAKPMLARPPKDKLVYLQPEDSKREGDNARNMEAVVNSCLEHGYTLQLQIHKILGVE